MLSLWPFTTYPWDKSLILPFSFFCLWFFFCKLWLIYFKVYVRSTCYVSLLKRFHDFSLVCYSANTFLTTYQIHISCHGLLNEGITLDVVVSKRLLKLLTLYNLVRSSYIVCKFLLPIVSKRQLDSFVTFDLFVLLDFSTPVLNNCWEYLV